jgi:hypothetical protein
MHQEIDVEPIKKRRWWRSCPDGPPLENSPTDVASKSINFTSNPVPNFYLAFVPK